MIGAKIWPICEVLASVSYPAAVESGCRAVGLRTGRVRVPLLDLTDERRVAGLVARAGA